MDYTNITVETRENLGIITLNRPQALNAVNAEMLKELALAAEAFDNNDAVRVLIVKGDGKTFAAGIDIKEVLSRADSKFLGIDEMQRQRDRPAQRAVRRGPPVRGRGQHDGLRCHAVVDRTGHRVQCAGCQDFPAVGRSVACE